MFFWDVEVGIVVFSQLFAIASRYGRFVCMYKLAIEGYWMWCAVEANGQ